MAFAPAHQARWPRSAYPSTSYEASPSTNKPGGYSKQQWAPSGGIPESELRLANAELILWALNEETEPTPLDLANRWVVEYVWQVWITEAGPTIRNHSANGYDSHRVEQEMRAALEAIVVAGGLHDDRSLTTQDFEQAIASALKSLERIGTASS